MENKERYFIPDIETGFRQEVSEQQWEAYQRMWEYLRPRVDSVKGTILIFGTGGDIDNQNFNEFYGK